MLQLKMIKQKLPLPHIRITIWVIYSILKVKVTMVLIFMMKQAERSV